MAGRIISLVEEARGKVAKTANVAFVYTYYEVGRMIIEDEQGGKKRATYGKAHWQICRASVAVRVDTRGQFLVIYAQLI